MSLAIKASRVESQGGMAGVVESGDPGLFGFLGSAIKGGLGLAGRMSGLLPGRAPAPRVPTRPVNIPFGPSLVPRAPSTLRRAAQMIVPGGATGFEGLGCPSGFHPNKGDYFLRDGSFVAKGSRCVRNRRRNPMNPRALSRAIGRVDSGKRLQHRLAQIETGKYSKAGNRKS